MRRLCRPLPEPGRFALYYAVSYMSTAVFNVFIPLYLNSLGYSRSVVGTLLALGPFAALVLHPAWGLLADRARSKNTVLAGLILGAAAAVLLFPLSSSLPLVLFFLFLFSAFQASIIPLSDAITLERAGQSGWSFGPVRLAGTVGFALMAVVAGFSARWRIGSIFPLYAVLGLLAFLVLLRLPKVRGHQSAGPRFPPGRLFRSRALVLVLAFHFLLQFTLGFYYSFFAIHLKELGGDASLQGWAVFITATAELPFLLNADRILARLGLRRTLLLAGGILSLRWLAFYLVSDRFLLMALNATHGVTVIVFIYCLATFINRHVPRELRASGHALNAMLCIGAARILGSVLGGVLSDRLGIRPVFLLFSLVAAVSVAVFAPLLLGKRPRRAPAPDAAPREEDPAP